MANRPKDTLAARDYAIQQWNKGNNRVDKRFNNIHVKSAKGNRILIYGDSSSSKNGRQVLGTVHRDYINHRYGQEGTTYNKNYGKATYSMGKLSVADINGADNGARGARWRKAQERKRLSGSRKGNRKGSTGRSSG